MAVFDEEGINPQFPLEGGYKISFASGTSFFNVKSIERTQEGVWSELNETGYELIGNRLFTIDSARKNPSVLSGTSPRVHIEVALPNSNQSYKKGYIVLIFDSEGSLVDWSVANQLSEVSSFFEPADSLSLYFDIPLMPISRQSLSDRQQAFLLNGDPNFLDQIGEWDEEQEPLFFGIFSFEDNEFNSLFYPFYLGLAAAPIHSQARTISSAIAVKIARKADRYLKHNSNGDEQLQIISQNGNTRMATPQDLQQMRGPVLLLCHGIFSSTKGAFSGTTQAPGILDDQKFLALLYPHYGGNILAWDHYTLSKTTADNAADLLGYLIDLCNVDLDVICHSRGAGVIRNLVENNNHQQQLALQNLNVNKVIFVAGACLGSQLADSKNTNRMFRSLNMIYWYFGGAPVGFISGILTVLKLLATIAQKMPGVEAMNPTGKEIATLNLNTTTKAVEYCYIRANYDFSNLPAKLAQEFLWNDILFGGANDLVVPYDGASASNNYLPVYAHLQKVDVHNFGTATQRQSVVMHTNFFAQSKTKNELWSLLQ